MVSVDFNAKPPVPEAPIDPYRLPRAPGLMDFQYQTLLGTAAWKLDNYLPTTTYNGLPMSNQYIYSRFTAEDGSTCCVTRPFTMYDSAGCALFSGQSDDKRLATNLEAMATAWRGELQRHVSDGHIGLMSMDGWQLPEPALGIKLTKDGRMVYVERDILRLDLEHVGPSMQWFAPAPGESMAWVTSFYRGTGTILGKRVEGWLGYDTMYLDVGKRWQDDAFVIRKGVQLAWTNVCNEYADGTRETGIFGGGYGRFGYALIANERGEVVGRSRTVRTRISEYEDGYPAVITFSFRDEDTDELQEWVWTAEPFGRIHLQDLVPSAAHKRDCEGVMVRRGETRDIKHNLGWLDYHADGRNDQLQHAPFAEEWKG